MDHGDAVIIGDHTDFERCPGHGWADEHRQGRVVGLKSAPVLSYCVKHVVIRDIVLSGRGLDVHHHMLGIKTSGRQQMLTPTAGQATRDGSTTDQVADGPRKFSGSAIS